MAKKVRVLIVDDSALMRKLLEIGLSADPRIEVIGVARDPYQARDILVTERPDVMTLDIEMPRMDGLRFLRTFMPVLPTPTIVLSSLTPRGCQLSLDCLEAGAVDVLLKPQGSISEGIPAMMTEICDCVVAAAGAKLRVSTRAPQLDPSLQEALDQSTDQVIVIGASTGGVAAITQILPRFPATTPGIVLVEHLPPGFSDGLAARLNNISTMRVREAAHGDRVLSGLVLVAPGGIHTEIVRSGGEYRIKLGGRERVSGHVPSVDVLFHSAAQSVGKNAVGVLMTGMGADGAKGLLEMRRAGARTCAQDEATSVIFGMPAAAWENGAAEALVALDDIPAWVCRAVARK